MLLALMQWGDRWKWPGARGPVSVVHSGCGSEVRPVPYCAQCERELSTAELRAKPRRGVLAALQAHEPGNITGQRLLAGRREGLSLER